MRDNGPILLVEDDSESAELLRIAFQKAGLRRPLRVLPDGEKAVAYLSGDPPYDDPEENPPPCLVLLDLKLPRRSGLEVLSWLRSRINTRPLPVVMMTSSAEQKDIEEALRLGIQAYVVKPSDFDDLKKLARVIRRKVEGEDASADEDPRPVRPSTRRF
jgi:DNA-binding response OmpR family regulator